MGFSIEAVTYNLGSNPSKLKHRRRNIWECFISLIEDSHICQICGRKEDSVHGWLQIDDPVYKDKDGCSVICVECEKMNPEVFNI